MDAKPERPPLKRRKFLLIWLVGNFAAIVAVTIMNPAVPPRSMSAVMFGSSERLLEDISAYVLIGLVVLSPVVAIWASEGLKVGLRVAAVLGCLFMASIWAFGTLMVIENALADHQLAEDRASPDVQ
jgi:uncharacterized membrane protein